MVKYYIYRVLLQDLRTRQDEPIGRVRPLDRDEYAGPKGYGNPYRDGRPIKSEVLSRPTRASKMEVLSRPSKNDVLSRGKPLRREAGYGGPPRGYRAPEARKPLSREYRTVQRYGPGPRDVSAPRSNPWLEPARRERSESYGYGRILRKRSVSRDYRRAPAPYQTRDTKDLRGLRDMTDIRDGGDFADLRQMRDTRDMRGVRDIADLRDTGNKWPSCSMKFRASQRQLRNSV